MNPKASNSKICLYKIFNWFELEESFSQQIKEIPFRIMSDAAGLDENKTKLIIAMKENQNIIEDGMTTFINQSKYYEEIGMNHFYDKMIIFNNPDVISFHSVMHGCKVDSLKMKQIAFHNMSSSKRYEQLIFLKVFLKTNFYFRFSFFK